MTGYLFRPPWNTPESRAGRPPVEEQVSYDSLGSGLAPRRAEFQIAFGRPLIVHHRSVSTSSCSPATLDNIARSPGLGISETPSSK